MSPQNPSDPNQSNPDPAPSDSDQSEQGSVFYRWAPTFMRRSTHMNTSAKLGLTEPYQHWYAPITSTNLRELFAEPEHPLTVEIGFGMGHTLIQMALGSYGVTIVPELALDQLKIADHERQVLPLNEPGPHRRLAFISRLNYARTDDVQYLCRSFKESLAQATTEA